MEELVEGRPNQIGGEKTPTRVEGSEEENDENGQTLMHIFIKNQFIH